MSQTLVTRRRRGRPIALGAALAATLVLLATYANSKDNGLPGGGNNTGDSKKAYDAVITGAPKADAARSTASTWANKIKSRGYTARRRHRLRARCSRCWTRRPAS